ncbi:hypothetical protein ACFP1I_08860 [Dyadobacter subterraneus]|uniref:Uncharacterized protein n=1 Tax=Dyadobacter subterraneus TaxID=2773304 RepID=A0ABR9WE96_9BACT|nr:hypothetical protein [Dyadobacter subterraneus]MBE9463750.1 hypothetical protein [Dyadobacter subterraneus]
MKRNLYYVLAVSHAGLAQRFCHIEADTASKQFILVQDKTAIATSRILDSEYYSYSNCQCGAS